MGNVQKCSDYVNISRQIFKSYEISYCVELYLQVQKNSVRITASDNRELPIAMLT
jgi:hypothetical protein